MVFLQKKFEPQYFSAQIKHWNGECQRYEWEFVYKIINLYPNIHIYTIYEILGYVCWRVAIAAETTFRCDTKNRAKKKRKKNWCVSIGWWATRAACVMQMCNGVIGDGIAIYIYIWWSGEAGLKAGAEINQTEK